MKNMKMMSIHSESAGSMITMEVSVSLCRRMN